MAKTQHRKPAPKPQQRSSSVSAADFIQNVRLQSWLIFAFAFLLYANTLRHGFVLDDGIVITENMYTQQGIKGIGGILSHDTFYGFFKGESGETLVSGGRYRPMSLVLFACLYQVAGASPFLFHLFTVLLFALSCVVLHRTLLLLLAPVESAAQNNRGHMVAWLAAVLFTAHPIHTEVVANIKCCDEILAMLGSLAALYFALKAWDAGQNKWTWLAGISFFAACLSKENAVAFVVLIPLALWFFRSSGENTAQASVWKTALPVFTACIAFFVLRGSILPWSSVVGGGEPLELLNNPFLKYEGGQWVKFAPAEKLATIFYTLWKYLQLLFIPHPLTHDYYPRHVDIMTFAHPMVLLSLVAYGFMAFWVVRGLQRRDHIVFGILMFLLPLGIVSNLVFPVGTNMSERFVFLPSVGFCFVAGVLLTRFSEKNRSTILGAFALVVLLFSIKTMMRNPVWQSNERLFLNDIAVSENSVKLRTACAQALLDRARNEKDPRKRQLDCQEAIAHIEQAFKFYPNFKTAYIIRAGVYAALQQYPESVADYRKALALAPDDPNRKTMLAIALRDGGKYYGQQKKDLANAFKYLNESWQVNPADPETARLLGVANYVQGKQAEAIEWYKKAEAVAPRDAASLWELGLAYGNLGDFAKAQELHQRATAIDPAIAQKAVIE